MTRVLFLGGLGRSGTTLVERVLGELPGACALGEVVHLWRRDLRDDERCGCGSRFSGCSFWKAVGQEAFGGWDRVDVDRIAALQATVERTRHIPRLARQRVAERHRDLIDEYVGWYARLYAAAAKVGGARVVVDSSKHSALAHCLRWSMPTGPGPASQRDAWLRRLAPAPTATQALDLRVVHVVRDPRGVAYSWTKTVARPEADGEEMTRYSPGRSALLWTAHNAAFGLLGRRGVPLRRVRYEQFLADPRRAVRDLAEFAGLEIGDRDLEFLGDGHADLRPGHSAAGNPMRFAVGRVALRRDDAWLAGLPAPQRRLVGALTAPMLTSYGYPLRAASPEGAAP